MRIFSTAAEAGRSGRVLENYATFLPYVTRQWRSLHKHGHLLASPTFGSSRRAVALLAVVDLCVGRHGMSGIHRHIVNHSKHQARL